jgi:hypothetical protein
VFGANLERVEHVVFILGEIMSPKTAEEPVLRKLADIVRQFMADATIGPAFK